MINENQFQGILPEFEGRGYTVDQYMVPAFYWLGWGIEGNRKHYSYNYSKKLDLGMIIRKLKETLGASLSLP